MPTDQGNSNMDFPGRSHRTTDRTFTWDEVRALLDKETMRRAEYLASILEALRGKYGEAVLEVAAEVIYNLGYQKGKARAELVERSNQSTDLPSLARLISHEMAQLYLGNSVEVGEDGLIVSETYCPLPRKWKEMGLDDRSIIGYCHLFDQVDKGMVEGYNPEFAAELSGCTGLAEKGFCQMVVRKKKPSSGSV